MTKILKSFTSQHFFQKCEPQFHSDSSKKLLSKHIISKFFRKGSYRNIESNFDISEKKIALANLTVGSHMAQLLQATSKLLTKL